MEQFDYSHALEGLMTPDVTSALATLHEHKGKQVLYESTHPDALDGLVEVAKIQSTEASNKIENISTSDKRLRDLMLDKTKPKNRDEREIAGYRYVLDLIHESYEGIPVTPNVILQLHRDLYRFEDKSFAGEWKDTDNVIAEQSENGKLIARFRPTTAVATPTAVAQICDEYAKQLKTGTYDPLLVSLVWIFDFVSIHPFNDGNGRMSRILTLLLLYRCGYTVGKYISIEKEIERTKKTYYETLASSSIGWHEGQNDYVPFVTYMLGVLVACYKELDRQFPLLNTPKGNYELLRTYFETTMGSVTKYDIMNENPSMSKRTIERLLKRLQDEGLIEKVGAARSTKYRRRD